MISKGRLEELIEQEATIYDPDTMWKSIGEIKLNKKMKIKDGRLDGDLGDLGLKGAMCSCFVPLEDLVESKEEAEWIIEFGCIERTERLELPTWEDVSKDFIPLKVASGQYPVVEFGDNSIEIIVNVNKDIQIVVWSDFVGNFVAPLTKENYTLACRKAKELFLGEKDE